MGEGGAGMRIDQFVNGVLAGFILLGLILNIVYQAKIWGWAVIVLVIMFILVNSVRM